LSFPAVFRALPRVFAISTGITASALLAAQSSPASAELRALLNDRLSLASNYASAALVLGILVLMVFKP